MIALLVLPRTVYDLDPVPAPARAVEPEGAPAAP
jgi:hypothetical protein